MDEEIELDDRDDLADREESPMADTDELLSDYLEPPPPTSRRSVFLHHVVKVHPILQWCVVLPFLGELLTLVIISNLTQIGTASDLCSDGTRIILVGELVTLLLTVISFLFIQLHRFFINASRFMLMVLGILSVIAFFCLLTIILKCNSSSLVITLLAFSIYQMILGLLMIVAVIHDIVFRK